ncbi:MAG TPA: hypothetical protein VFI13_12830 [Gemmatimonadales bacterium]|nr:hypothetical protein [Gemmatimonadales bacterium]
MSRRGAILAMALAAACGSGRAPRRHEIRISAMQYLPADLVVAPGDSVVWIDADPFPHTATADPPGTWEVGPVDPGTEGVWIAGAAGSYPYHCRLHPTMQGRITVRAQR